MMTRVLSRENNLNRVFDELKAEYTDISRGTSIVQKLVNSVEVREGCLRALRDLLEGS